jgi:hypothetical protein
MNASCPQAYTIPGVDSMQADITTPMPLTPLHLAPVGAKAVDLDFDAGRLASDGGLVLRKDTDEQLGVTRALAAVLKDTRDPQTGPRYLARPAQTTRAANCCRR